ncbi:ligand-dependent nuclear receptor-interacting factor 1 [Xyrichtys novacula]|uniref:Ligand-dependent nuclear receptor-interacting factor 1 n=1 Tax=Xyrichtys novacula TaxID=13765 RepID=A0AAV1F3E9_XYRNO|nr:ligand-dependent nuclear receptor-interacting factor 1 [Xyrichtys novacula]
MYAPVKDTPGGSGIIYQAVPAVGANGQNIMRLIPFQMVKNGLVQSQTSQPKTSPSLRNAVTANMTPLPAQVVASDPHILQFLRMQVLPKDVYSKGDIDLHHSQDKPLPQKKVPVSEKPAAHSEKTAAHCVKSQTLPGHVLVANKTSCIPRRLTVPASEPTQPIITSSAISTPDSSLDLVYISPIKPVNVDFNLVSTPSPPLRKLLPKKTPYASSFGPKPGLMLVPQAPQKPNSPTKWRIEEKKNSRPPQAVVSSYVASEVIRAVAKREKGCRPPDVMYQNISLMSQDTTGQREEDTVVLCNGKVFSKHAQIGQNDPSRPATKTYVFTKTNGPSPKLVQKKQVIIQSMSSKVIDLCDDTQEDISKQVASAATSSDEDNVIFMSYTPPKLKLGTAEDFTPKAAPGKKPDQMGSGGDGGAERTGTNPSSVRDAARMSMYKNEHLYVISQQSLSTLQEESVSNPSQNTCLESKSQQISDHRLRQMFGVTADVKICLQRIDEASTAFSHVEHHHCKSTMTEGGHQESNSSSCGVKSEEELSSEYTSLTLYSHISPLKCSHFEPGTKTLSASENKVHQGQREAEADSLISYMEPIDEDVLSTDEKDSPHKQDITTEAQEDKRRIGRTRKRTTCPCCFSGSPIKAVKWSLKTDLAEKFAGQRRRKDGAKTARKRGRLSGKMGCQTVKRRTDTADWDRSGTASVDSDELRCHEEIRRLRELLREKEAALELLRKNCSRDKASLTPI